MEQGKVSMVVPCYNKEPYISDMLRSVYNQVWDNIELILVNDGSTDGTRRVISEWEPKLRERGYNVVTIDQENAGCCAAVYNGMLRMTGEYFCLVDCDDEIMPEYVSKTAGWLDEHDDYDMAACNYASYRGTREDQILNWIGKTEATPDEDGFLENFLLCKIYTAAWMYMSRRERAMRVVEHFCTERRKTYEPCIVIPLAAGGAKLKYFPEPLYKFNLYANGFVGFKDFGQVNAYYDDYAYLHSWVINQLDIAESEKRRLIAMGKLGCIKRKLSYAKGDFAGEEASLLSAAVETLKLLDEIFVPAPCISRDKLAGCSDMLFRAVEQRLFNSGDDCALNSYSRIIAYGTLGQSAEKKLSRLAYTTLSPVVLWDGAAKPDSRILGNPVLIPNLSELTADDLVIIIPGAEAARKEISALLKSHGFCNYIQYRDIEPAYYFPELYGDRRFSWESN